MSTDDAAIGLESPTPRMDDAVLGLDPADLDDGHAIDPSRALVRMPLQVLAGADSLDGAAALGLLVAWAMSVRT